MRAGPETQSGPPGVRDPREQLESATVAVLVLAGLIEGSFSQFTGRTFPHALKSAVAALLFALLMAWLFARRGEAAR